MTVDGFGGLTCESCKQDLYCHTDRASLGCDPRTDDGFGALMCKSVRSHTDSAWGGGGGIFWGGIGGGGVGEPRTGIIYRSSRL